MIETHDEVELIDVLTLMEAVSSIAGRGMTARMIADVHLAVKWFHEMADFSGINPDHPYHDGVSDWNWDACLVLESLSATNSGSLAREIYLVRRFTKTHVKRWILSHQSWRVKGNG